MRSRRWILAMLGVASRLAAQEPEFRWNIPAPFPKPPVPADNPMTSVKVELGRRLFYEKRMSVTGEHSCASCHRQELAFTDGRGQAEGATHQLHPRGSMSLANIAYSPALTWANPTLSALEEQALVPMLGSHPLELGLNGQEERFLKDLLRDPIYQKLFPRAFPETSDPYTITNVVRAIAAFERTIISMGSSYDRYRYGGDQNAISESAKRGETFFFSGQRGSCFQCHGGWNFSGDIRYEGRADVPSVVLQHRDSPQRRR